MTSALTVFTSEQPRALGKTYSLDSGNRLAKTTAGQMSRGTFEVRSFATASEFVGILESLSKSQALSSSLPLSGKASGRVVTERALPTSPAAVARTKRHFGLPTGQAGFALIDVDAPKTGDPLRREELWSILQGLCPSLSGAGVVWWPSGSSCIYNGDAEVQGIRGQHFYVMVKDLGDLHRFGRALNQRLWLAGHGHIEVSASGAMLERTIVDASVHQPARLVFSAGSVCAAPLTQRRGSPVVLSDGAALDTRAALPDLSAEEHGRYVALVESAKLKAEPEAGQARDKWRSDHERQAMQSAIDRGADPAACKEATIRALEAALSGTLLGNFQIIVVDEGGNEHAHSVDDVLKDRERFHLARCLDPLNPEHRGRSADAILYLNQPQPVCYSLDEGGTLYRLLRQPLRMPVVNGERARLAEQIAAELAQHEDLFNQGGQPCLISSGSSQPLTKPLLAYIIGCRIALYRQGRDRTTPAEPDHQLLDMVAALLPTRLRTVVARSTIPLITPEGRLIERPGFDSDTGIYIDIEPGTDTSVSAEPTRADCIEALRRLWKPWSAYRWADAHSRAAMLATVLTVPLRPTIEAAPGLFADAPSQASGKSKAIGAVAVLARGFRGGAKTWVSDAEEELEKWTLAVARSGDPAALLDNITGTMRSPALAVAMAEGKASGRLLGVTQTISPDARLMWLASGNNASLDRDMSTRWLIARIDTGRENPSELTYTFDPVSAALADRMGIVRAALTLHHAWHSAQRPKADSIGTRFAEWGQTVRHLTLWLRESGIAADAGLMLGDPAHTILSGAAANDPEHEATAEAWHALWEAFPGGMPFTASDVRTLYDQAEQGAAAPYVIALRDSFQALAGFKATPATRQLHTVMQHRRDRIAGGLVLKQCIGARATEWRITPAVNDG